MFTEFEGCKKCKSFSAVNRSQSGYCMRKKKPVFAPNVKECEEWKPVKAGSFLNEYLLNSERKTIDGYTYYVN